MSRRGGLLPVWMAACLVSLSVSAARPLHRISDTIRVADFQLPMRHTPLLSASFGELRADHFHSGVDFKTEGQVGKEVFPAADGWVSRIGITQAGYGKALYISHPNGYTTVYGHLKDFSPRIDSILKAAQYKRKSYTLQLMFAPGEIPVSAGEVVAYSGNTGGSGGPHLHFEVRDTRTEEPIDPMLWYADRLEDHIRPRIQQIALYVRPGSGVLSTRQSARQDRPVASAATRMICDDAASLPAVWGRIGLAFKSFDYMSDQANFYGIASASLYVDSVLVFRREMNRFSFDESRYINSAADYGQWAVKRSWLMKTFRDPACRLDLYPVRLNDGYLDIDEERIYHCRFEVDDRFGNRTAWNFSLRGCRMPFAAPDTESACFWPGLINEVRRKDFTAVIDRNALYDTIPFSFSQLGPVSATAEEPSARRMYSDRYRLLNEEIPCHTRVKMKLRIQDDVLPDKKNYYVAREDSRSGLVWEGGEYKDGFMEVTSRRFGTFVVLADTVAPKIYIPDVGKAMKNAFLRIRVSDEYSGVAGYEVRIDGRWALFEDDYKNRSIFFRPDEKRFPPTGGAHRLTVKVWDACGNVTEEEREYIY